MEKESILPQTIFKFKCEDLLLHRTLSLLSSEEWQQSRYNLTTVNKRLEKNPDYVELINWFHNCLEQVKIELNFKCDNLKIVQCWGNKATINQWHYCHIHPNSVVSGIFYVSDSNAKTWFSMNSIWNGFNGILYENFRLNYEDFGTATRLVHKENTVAGNLIIFPSSLTHSVDEHKIPDYDRYTISFNSFPSGQIGDFMQASGCEIYFE